MPEWKVDDVLAIADLRQHSGALSKIDDHTIGIRIADVSFVPIPVVTPGSYAALLTIGLPQTVVTGQAFTVDIRQYSRSSNVFDGAFRFSIPVSIGDAILPHEVRRLAALRHVAGAIPQGNRWSRCSLDTWRKSRPDCVASAAILTRSLPRSTTCLGSSDQ